MFVFCETSLRKEKRTKKKRMFEYDFVCPLHKGKLLTSGREVASFGLAGPSAGVGGGVAFKAI